MTTPITLLLNQFDHLLTTPAAVEELNRAILTLAMQGKLVEQDPQDEPAAQLLKRIKAEKFRLVKESQLPESDPLPPVNTDEIPFDLPKGWEWVRLGEIITLWNGRAYSRNELLDAGTPIIRIQNLNGGQDWFYSNLNLSDEKYCNNGDLLYAWSGTFSPYIWNGGRAIYHYHIWRIDLYCDLSKSYVYHLLNSVSAMIKESSHGVMLPHMTKGGMEEWIVPLPPLAEQHRIVARVEALFTQTRQLAEKLAHAQHDLTLLNQAALAHLLAAETPEEFAAQWAFIAQHFDSLFTEPEHITPLRQAILELAVRGKLTRRESTDEPASELLKRIAAQRDPKGLSRPLGSVRENEKPFELPEGWEWVRLDELSKAIEYGTSEKASEYGDIPVLRMNNIFNGAVVLDSLKFVSKTITDLPRLYLLTNDLLFNRTNSYELVGKTGVFKGNDNKFTFASYLIRVQFFCKLISVDYINFYFNTPICRTTQIEPSITQQTGQANFNGTKLRNIVVPLPPLAEQHRIVAQVEHLLGLCDALAAKLRSAREERIRLTAAVLAGIGGPAAAITMGKGSAHEPAAPHQYP